MNSIKENYLRIKETIPSDVKLVAVSKFNPADSIRQVYDCGQRIFGESKVQELTEKYNLLPQDIEWHFIGHLQTNKVKYITPFISLIHSVDSAKLFNEINKAAEKENQVIDVLIQIHVAQENTTDGFYPEATLSFIKRVLNEDYSFIKIRGIMGMATFTDDEDIVRSEFRILKSLFDEMKNSYFTENKDFDTLSFGMSDDYKIAIEEGSNMVRIGSSIFGERMYI